MTEEAWSAVDEYVSGLLAPHDEALRAALLESDDAGLPAIQVSPPQGKLLHLLARSIAARTILEFGTLGAYSTIWLARALPEGGRLITLEAEPRNAEVAAANVERAGLADRVDLRVGAALDLLPRLEAEDSRPSAARATTASTSPSSSMPERGASDIDPTLVGSMSDARPV